MFKNIFDFLKELIEKFFASRILVLGVAFGALVIVLFSRLYSLQIQHGEEYQEDYSNMTQKTVSTDAARGRIFDRSGNLLAYNELTYNVIIRDNGDYSKAEDKNSMLYRLVQIMNDSNQEIEGSFMVGLDANGNYVYTTTSESARKGFLRDLYGLKSTSELDDEAGNYPSDITAEELVDKEFEYFKLDQMKGSDGSKPVLTKREKIEIINIRYTMNLTAYKKYEETTIAKDVSENCRISILENASDILGVDVVEGSKRVYNDAIYFSSLIGYIGKVTEEQLAELQTTDSSYTANDIVGRTGIEQYMEGQLHGTKGSKTMTVDNMGRIQEIVEETDSVAGNDLYLTIDRDMQIGIYNLLERQLAGVLISKIVNEDNPNEDIHDASDLLIPVKDAYYQLIGNNVIDIDRFSSGQASDTEQEIYAKFSKYKDSSLEAIREELTTDNPKPLSQLPDDINAFMVYIVNKLVSEDIIVDELIDQNSDYYKGWKNDTISMRDYLYAGIANNWLDTSVLDVRSKYSDADDIFLALVDYIEDSLRNDKDYYKLTYRHLIRQGTVTGRELCIVLFDQGIIKYNDNQYQSLMSKGEAYAYEFLIDKISKIEITPAQLALDPCTAGCVITDVNTGEIRAIVSYPGYDNNKLTNTMDVAYYNSLINDQSLPLYNNATQAKKAPGSTFKPIMAVAALEEGVIDQYGTVNCDGIFKEINPPIRCWVYPNQHGELDVVGGIKNSCNVFFSEMGHRLAMDNQGNYSTDLGLTRIRKYATFFGLDHKSGVEMQETEPSISTISPEQSAIGQGSHSFTNVQLSRYVSAIANRGTVFELSVLDKITDCDGRLLVDYSPEVNSHLNFSSLTWDLVQKGMHEVTTSGSAAAIFGDLEFDIAGKTGTAQESAVRANHAFFVSFAPYENPEIAVTVNIPYGYSSSNAATVARNVYRFYFGYLTLDDILEGGALGTFDVKIGD